NLFVGERPHLLAIDDDRANQFVLLEHWHPDNSASASSFDKGNGFAVFPDVGLVSPEVGDVNNLFRPEDAGERGCWMFAKVDDGIAQDIVHKALHTVDSDGTGGVTFEEPKIAERGLTNTSCVREHGLKHALQLARRT